MAIRFSLHRRRPAVGLLAPLCLSVFLLSPIGCGPQDAVDEGDGVQAPSTLPAEQVVTVPVFADDPSGRSVEIVFQSIRVVGPNGQVVSEDRKGTLTLEAWQRAA